MAKAVAMKSFKKISPAWFLGLVVILVDFMTKYFVASHLSPTGFYDMWYPYGGLPVFENFLGVQFSINYVTNMGAAWGVLSDFKVPLLLGRIALVLGLLGYLCFYNKDKQLVFPFALIIGGAIGNIIDVFLYGHVIDMFHFIFWGYDYPVFNVADSSIFIGIAWLIIHSFMPKKKKKKSRR